jgi:hypothetical protein
MKLVKQIISLCQPQNVTLIFLRCDSEATLVMLVKSILHRIIGTQSLVLASDVILSGTCASAAAPVYVAMENSYLRHDVSTVT